MNIKQLNEKIEKLLLEDKPTYKKFCDLDVSRTNMERHIGKDENGYAIFAWDRTSQKFDGRYNYDWVRRSPYFQSEEDAIQWFADGLLKHTDMDDIIEGWKDGSFEIYDDRLIKLLNLDNIKAGKYESPSIWPTGEFKDRLVPTYLTMPKGPQRNNARREYIRIHGKPSELEESLQYSANRILEKINTEDELEMDKEDVEEMIDSIIKAIPQITYYIYDEDNMTSSTFKPEKRQGYYNVIDFKGYLYGETKRIATIIIKSYGKKVRVRLGLPYPKHGDFYFPAYMKKYAVSDDFNSFVISYFEETKEEIVEDIVENFKRIFVYDSKIKKDQEKLQPEFEKVRKDILYTLLLKYSDKNNQVINLLDLDLDGVTAKDKLEGLYISLNPDKDTLEQKCKFTHFGTVRNNRIDLDSPIDRKLRTESMLEAFKKVLKFLTGEDDKEALKKAKRQEYNRKRQAEKKAQKLADSKPFDKFLQELKDKYGYGYIAQDVYGYTYVYKNKPYFIPTKEGYQGGEEFYEPGYWDGDRVDNIDYESKLNQAYKDQYRQDTPSAEKAIWSF